MIITQFGTFTVHPVDENGTLDATIAGFGFDAEGESFESQADCNKACLLAILNHIADCGK